MPRIIVYVCDHMRIVAKVDGEWQHQQLGGSLASPCHGNVYRTRATLAPGWSSLVNIVTENTDA